MTAIARIAVLASGSGTNLQTLIDHQRDGTLGGTICAVLSDQPNARALQRAEAAGIDAYPVRVRRTGEDNYDLEIIERLNALHPDLVVLAGYMRILSAECVAAFADRIVNLHPSLLPKHKGNHTHRRVLASGDSEHGATVHFVTAELDGGPPILQYRLHISPADTEATLSARVQRGEHIILPTVVQWFCAGRLRMSNGQVMLDGNRLTTPEIVQECT